jgi:vacuolar-type H+-ATPase subunit I/STV1
LVNTSKKSFFSFLVDNRLNLESDQLTDIASKKAELLLEAQQLRHLNTLKSELNFTNKLKIKTNQQILIGKKLDNLEEAFEQFVEELKTEFLAVHPEENLDLIEPILQINRLEIHDIINVIGDKQELFHEFIHQMKIDFLHYNPFLKQLKSEITELEITLGATKSIIPAKLIYDLKALYSIMEIEDNYLHFQSHIFSPVPKSSAKFIFINIPNYQISAMEKVLNDANLSYQQIEWNEEIVNWKNTSGLTPFQNIAQSMGTISKNEADPSVFISFFFILFFAIGFAIIDR